MKLNFGIIPLFTILGILIIFTVPVDATPGCTIYLAEQNWYAYDDIYTGKVIPTDYDKNYQIVNFGYGGWHYW